LWWTRFSSSVFKERPFKIEVEQDNNQDETNPEDCMEFIMEESLLRVAKIATMNKKTSISILRDLT